MAEKPLFPLFLSLDREPCLLVGGGTVALRKAEKLLPFGPRLTVVAPDILPALAALPGLTLCRRAFAASDVDGQRLVIAATNDAAHNHAVAAACRARGIPVNVVDDPAECGFFFPALVQRGPLSVGISTGGASPTAAISLKNEIDALLPERLDEILCWLERRRPAVKAAVAEEKTRAAVFAELFEACRAAGRPLTDAEFAAVLAHAADEGEAAADEKAFAASVRTANENAFAADDFSAAQKPEPALTAAQDAEKPRHGAGRVYLVGAGCGPADWITVRGQRLLQTCDAVVYDDLIDPALLALVPEHAVRISVGKRSGRHSAAQEQINRILVRQAQLGRVTVRLKGGDPFVFGRGGEEMEALCAAGIPCEEVPGISSAIAIPAAAGIPVTHRNLSRSFHEPPTPHRAARHCPTALTHWPRLTER